MKRNAGTFTSDGIELGGERVAYEIEECLDALAAEGYNIRKLSVVGYSLGGLVGRYAIGLLEARGWLDKLEPVNFTTFATPHVGVRTPQSGILYSIWNILGARAISMSGRQLFMIDSFRDTGKPLLSVMADPEMIFMRALTRFKHRCLYSNIVNDRTAVFYTTYITTTDPFSSLDLDEVPINYVKGYEPVIIDPNEYIVSPSSPAGEEETDPLTTNKMPTSLTSSTKTMITKVLTNLPLWLSVSFVVPIGMLLFLLNSVVQDFRSRRRIRLHGQGETGALFGSYKVPLIIQDVRDAVEDAIETAHPDQDPEFYRPASSDDESIAREDSMPVKTEALTPPPEPNQTGTGDSDDKERSRTVLALTPAQFVIVDSLNALGFRKYPVFIHNCRHSHAAMIVRRRGKKFEEGKIVVKHWLDNEFEV